MLPRLKCWKHPPLRLSLNARLMAPRPAKRSPLIVSWEGSIICLGVDLCVHVPIFPKMVAALFVNSIFHGRESKLSSKPEHFDHVSYSPPHSPHNVDLERQWRLWKINFKNQQCNLLQQAGVTTGLPLLNRSVSHKNTTAFFPNTSLWIGFINPLRILVQPWSKSCKIICLRNLRLTWSMPLHQQCVSKICTLSNENQNFNQTGLFSTFVSLVYMWYLSASSTGW